MRGQFTDFRWGTSVRRAGTPPEIGQLSPQFPTACRRQQHDFTFAPIGKPDRARHLYPCGHVSVLRPFSCAAASWL